MSHPLSGFCISPTPAYLWHPVHNLTGDSRSPVVSLDTSSSRDRLVPLVSSERGWPQRIVLNAVHLDCETVHVLSTGRWWSLVLTAVALCCFWFQFIVASDGLKHSPLESPSSLQHRKHLTFLPTGPDLTVMWKPWSFCRTQTHLFYF